MFNAQSLQHCLHCVWWIFRHVVCKHKRGGDGSKFVTYWNISINYWFSIFEYIEYELLNLILFEAIFYWPFYFCMREMYNSTFVYLKNFVLLYFRIPDSGFRILRFRIPDSGFQLLGLPLVHTQFVLSVISMHESRVKRFTAGNYILFTQLAVINDNKFIKASYSWCFNTKRYTEKFLSFSLLIMLPMTILSVVLRFFHSWIN